MQHPEIVRQNANRYHARKIHEAAAYRQAKFVYGKNKTLWNTLSLKFFPPKVKQQQARAHQTTLLESTS